MFTRLILVFVVVFGTFQLPPFPASAAPLGRCFHGGCDVIWKLNQRFDEGVRSKSEAMVGPPKQAFIESMDAFRDKTWTPMLTDIDRTAQARLVQIEGIVKTAEQGALAVIDRAAEQANRSVSNSVNEIRAGIIDATFKQTDALVADVSKQLHALIKDVDCKVAGQATNWQEWFADLLRVGNPLDRCFTDRGYYIGAPSLGNVADKYHIRKCQLERQLNAASTVNEVADAYWNLSVLARRYGCWSQEPVGESITGDDSYIYSRNVELWRLVSGLTTP